MFNEFFITLAVIGAALFLGILRSIYRHAFTVSQGFAGLLYQHGKFIEQLDAGRHIRWGRGFEVGLVDMRNQLIQMAGQDVLTSDSVGIKLSLMLACRITDPAKATHESQSWRDTLYAAAQLALRDAVGATSAEALLARRQDLGVILVTRLQPEGIKLGVHVLSAEVKDVIFPAELKRAFADVLKAKQEGQAALERARGESAALRNLANAARLLEGNPALMNLRVLQSLAVSQGAGNTLVMGVPGGFMPLKNGHARASGEATPAE